MILACGHDSNSMEVILSESGVKDDTESHERKPQKKKPNRRFIKHKGII